MLGKLRISFTNPELEAGYQASIQRARIMQMRLGLLMPAILYLVITFLDPLVLSSSISDIASNSHLFLGLFLILLVALSYSNQSMAYHIAMVSVGVLFSWSNHLYLTHHGALYELAGEGFLMVIWVWLVSGLNIWQSSVVMICFAIAFVVAQATHPMSEHFLPIYLFFIFAALLFGVIVGILSDYYRRQGYLAEQNRRKMESQFIQAQKMEAIGTLVGGIAHDFNNTLAAITGNLFLIRQNGSVPEDVVERVKLIESLSFRSAEVIKQLMVFSRKGVVSMEAFEISPLLESMVRIFRVGLPGEMSFEFHNRLKSEQNVLIMGDKNQIEQAVFNLMNNARDAVRERILPSITVTLERPMLLGLEIPGLENRDVVRITIRDNGCGIPADQIQHIYEPFYTTKNDGTGLGLSMVIGTVKTHDGVLQVESEPDEGTLFTLYLPVHAMGQLADNEDSTFQLASQSGGIILLADDNPEVLEATAGVLASMNYQVLTATNGREAVDLYRVHADTIDLVMMDVDMPVLGGVAAAEEIRAEHADARILFLTGLDAKQMLKERGVRSEDIMMKPLKIEAFSRYISQGKTD